MPALKAKEQKAAGENTLLNKSQHMGEPTRLLKKIKTGASQATLLTGAVAVYTGISEQRKSVFSPLVIVLIITIRNYNTKKMMVTGKATGMRNIAAR
ncbi:hypothetical protein B9548_003584 [Escherichia coli]|nr:hypothetical protein [Escherichia coli]